MVEKYNSLVEYPLYNVFIQHISFHLLPVFSNPFHQIQSLTHYRFYKFPLALYLHQFFQEWR